MSKILHIWVVVSAMTTGEEDIATLTVFTWPIAALEQTPHPKKESGFYSMSVKKNLRRLGNLLYSDNFNSILAKKSMKLELWMYIFLF